MKGSVLEKFRARCSEPAANGCIEWTGATDVDGYGLLSIWIPATYSTRTLRVHRYAWELVHGQLIPGQIVCHRCDNPPCVNVDHLFVGTTADNLADRDRKGRQARGERSGKSKLTELEVRGIKAALSSGQSTRSLAAEFGCSLSTINHIRYRRCWAWL